MRSDFQQRRDGFAEQVQGDVLDGADVVGDVVADKGVRVLFEAYTRLSHRVPLVLIGRNEAGIAEDPPTGVTVEYIRSYLDRPDEIAFSYHIP